MECWYDAFEANEEAYMSLWCQVDDLGPALCFSNTRLRDHFFNFVTRIRTNSIEAERLIPHILDFYRDRTVPFRIFVSPTTRPANLAIYLEQYGCVPLGERSVMVYQGTGRHPEQNPRIHIELISKSQLDIWTKVACQTWMKPIFPSDFRDIAFGAFQAGMERQNLHAYFAYADDTPAGTAILNVVNQVGGIHAVTTLPTYRGRGVGTALVLWLIEEAKRLGLPHLCLQTGTNDQGEQLYMRLGFRRVFTFIKYGPAK